MIVLFRRSCAHCQGDKISEKNLRNRLFQYVGRGTAPPECRTDRLSHPPYEPTLQSLNDVYRSTIYT